MFTGIVKGMAVVEEATHTGGVMRLRLRFPAGALDGLARGASVSIDGVCLTAVAFDDTTASFDVIDETLRRTTLGARAPGDRVNFERAATFGAEIGGHLLSGHILGVATVTARAEQDGNLALTLQAPPEAARFLMTKGYIAVDGVSLTIGAVDVAQGTFSLHLIPETRTITTLGDRRPGDPLNLEVDAMTQAVVETVARVLAARVSP